MSPGFVASVVFDTEPVLEVVDSTVVAAAAAPIAGYVDGALLATENRTSWLADVVFHLVMGLWCRQYWLEDSLSAQPDFVD